MKNELRIQDDLYQYVNQEWLLKTKIPDDLPYTAAFEEINDKVEKTMIKELQEMAKNEQNIEELPIKYAIRLFKKAMDKDKREEAGIKPILPLLDKIKGFKNIDDFNSRLSDVFDMKVPLPFSLEVVADFKDSSRHIFTIMDPSTILPDSSYYKQKLIMLIMLSSYKNMVKKILKLTPLSKKEQRQYLKDAIAFDSLLAPRVLTHADMADYVKLYNPREFDVVAEQLKPLDLNALIKAIYGDRAPDIIGCANPKFIEGFKEVFNENTFPLFIHWCYINTILNYASALSCSIAELSHSFFYKLAGVKKEATLEKSSYRLVSSLFDEPIGVYYGKKYFGEEAKQGAVDLTNKIIKTYKSRLQRNTFLEESTKEKAILKLSNIKVKMGYPDLVDHIFDKYVVNEEDSYFDALVNVLRVKRKHKFEELFEPVNPKKWEMPGHEVNACYDPFRNDVTFPAAILQKPFFSLEQSPSENLGGVGAIIGHEISHAFDNNGSHFDENGNLKDWWQEKDFEEFKKLTKGMTEQFNGIIYHKAKINGEMVVSENIADNGGMGVTLEIMHTLDNPDFKAYFINWATIWRIKAKESFTKLLIRMDVHSPSELRANMQPRNFSEWYEAFDVKETDKMFISEEKRISIW